MTEQQPYEVVGRRSGFELRRYPAHLVAEIEVPGQFEDAANRAFGPLAGYIGGANRSRRAVVPGPAGDQGSPGVPGGPDGSAGQERSSTSEGSGVRERSERIAMTAPVVQEEDGPAGTYRVQFVMPAGFSAETLPEPRDDRIHIREVPAGLAAAVRFSGRWTEEAFAQRAAALRDAVTAAGLRPAGPVRYARFNPPWTPWFLRRNEVVLPAVPDGGV